MLMNSSPAHLYVVERVQSQVLDEVRLWGELVLGDLVEGLAHLHDAILDGALGQALGRVQAEGGGRRQGCRRRPLIVPGGGGRHRPQGPGGSGGGARKDRSSGGGAPQDGGAPDGAPVA